MNITLTAGWREFSAWYLTPSVRFGLYRYSAGGFISLTFLRFEIGFYWVEA